ncbi:acyl-CoA desaturase-like, partial [Pollicipes pollicipes]|uniref:acyl-CoA desaturase-like n=1 Tax=Pollicipes pollicipes TaxID=41117 RepID=UPI001884DF50
RPPSPLVWRSVLFFVALHLLSVLGLIRALTAAHWLTSLFGIACYAIGGMGVTAGAHRLWSHRSYSARLPLRVLLMLMYTMAGQNHIYEWARDHRLHHRHSETDADPHNASRGFFFAHCGWLVLRKHPEVRRQGAKTDLSDLLADPVVMFQKRYYLPLAVLVCFAVPTVVPWYFWGESLTNAFLISVLKYVMTLHCTWLVNSAAHMWGMHPYDRHISPAENAAVALSAFGEGWHNYHHSFPWDYKTAELPGYGANLTTAFIDLCSRLGLAHSLKTVPADVVERRAARNGDGSYRKR